MESDSSDGDSAKSIPRPDFEAVSAIDSPQPQSFLHVDGGEMDTSSSSMPSKRQKYVVSAPPPGSANGSSNSSNCSMGASTAAPSSSLTMKLTKVGATQAYVGDSKIVRSSTPKQDSKFRVSRDLMALQKSHNESKVLTGFVQDGTNPKRRKSRYIAQDQPTGKTLSQSMSKIPRKSIRLAKKRSLSNPSLYLDSDDSWHLESSTFLRTVDSKTQIPKNSTRRFRSKTICFGNGDRDIPGINIASSENTEFMGNASLDTDQKIPAINTSRDADWPASSNMSCFSDVSESRTILTTIGPPTEIHLEEEEQEIEQRLREIYQEAPRDGWDPFCWKCRECGKLVPCCKCLRSYHTYCVRPASTKFDATWKCPECVLIESAPKRLRRNDVSLDLLSQLLSFALDRMKHMRGAHKIRSPQDILPQTYSKYFVNPVSFTSLSECIRNGAFHSADEFLSEVKWMQHNALILDADIKVEQASKAVVKICRQEANEIETCAECYLNANSSDEWFVKVCTHPHLLLWAKLKGFPYWPAKAMGSSANALVNVRFFGKHDRANVPVKDCFLYSERDPNTQTSRRSARDLAECIREVEVHISNIKRKIGSFNYAPYRTAYDPLGEAQQLEKMMPGVHDIIQQQLEPANKTPLQFLIRKTAGDKLSIVKKSKATESGNESDQASPNKKTLLATKDPELVTEHVVKPKSSNYEVIPRSANPLSESRGCTVILKRKSMAAKMTTPSPSSAVRASTSLVEVSTGKRKHSQSDASCTSETEHGHLSTGHKHKPKHPRKQVTAAAPAKLQEPSVKKTKEEDKSSESESSPTSGAVVSVVEMVRRRQGVTITKISKDNQQPGEGGGEASASPAVVVQAKPTVLQPIEPARRKLTEVERQQQQLISKVIPFIEIKKEVVSEPEEDTPSEKIPDQRELQPQQQQQKKQPQQQQQEKAVPPQPPPPPPEPQIAVPSKPSPPPEPPVVAPLPGVLPGIQIKEEILSEDEAEKESTQEAEPSSKAEKALEMTPGSMPPPPALPQRAPEMPPINREDTAASEFVRFVGDTTIQRVSQKQVPQKTVEGPPKRRGVPHGPLPAAAQASLASSSPASTSTSEPPSPSPSPSPKPANSYKTPNQSSLNIKSPAPIPTPVPQQQQLRVKSDRALNQTPPPQCLGPNLNATPATTTSSLLRSHMVVIPVEQAGGSNINNTTSPMAVPVPPLRAVSKNTLQQSTIPIGPAVGVPISLPPPLADLSVPPTPPSSTLTSSADSSGLLVNALNGLSNDLSSSESPIATADPITPGMAAALSEMVLRTGPPKLVARPCGPLHSDGSHIYPSQAGPLSRRLKDNAHKITDYFISVIEDTLSDLGSGEPSVTQARVAVLTLENERLKQHYERQLADMQRSTEMMIAEMRKTMEQDNKRVISELRQQSTVDRMRAVEEAKKKQWCANCMREAQLYCCWNTSYCDYPCQQMHWPRHSASCGQAVTIQTPLPPAEMSASRSRSKTSTPTATATNNTQVIANQMPSAQLNRSVPPAPTVVTAPSKKWQNNQPLMSMINQSSSEQVLKLPSNTYLRPVVSPMTSTVSVPPPSNSNNNTNMTTLITPSASSAPHMNSLLPPNRNAMSYKPMQPMPVPRFNIPLPITMNSNFGLMAVEQSQKQQQQTSKTTGRNSNKATNRVRNVNNSNNNNANNSAPGMRPNPNQQNQVFPQSVRSLPNPYT
ncbi:MYND-type zinc finger-containing chromatin reader Zmynd8 isoform X2 [Drosophila tropicalis]|uniref:MYND-type zinc finger-containing chromatin reader Zmynd8 isoform X2 n=1 Tax=Drosophila tropicalis TaxID=46794 RepID=UPI0035ABF43E